MSEALTERDKFVALIVSVLMQEKAVHITCSSEREARSLRRRLYRLRDGLDPIAKPIAEQVVFNVVGFRVLCQRDKFRQPVSTDWAERISYGES